MSTVPGLFAAGECGGGLARGQSAGRQFAVRSAGVRQTGGGVRGEVRQGTNARRRSTTAQVDDSGDAGAGAVRARRGGENPYHVQHELQDMMQDLVGIVRQRERDGAGARAESRS